MELDGHIDTDNLDPIEHDHLNDFSVSLPGCSISTRHASTQTKGLDHDFFHFKQRIKQEQHFTEEVTWHKPSHIQAPQCKSSPPISPDSTTEARMMTAGRVPTATRDIHTHPEHQSSSTRPPPAYSAPEEDEEEEEEEDHETRAANLSCSTVSSTVQDSYIDNKIYPKPVYSYSCLIAMALKQSEDQKLPVSEIYHYMQREFPYFRTAPEGWKNSVRHNLSLNKAFCKLDRDVRRGVNGCIVTVKKGCFWLLNPDKVEAMDREIEVWKIKHPEAIKASMVNPDDFWKPPNTGLVPPGTPPKQPVPHYAPYPKQPTPKKAKLHRTPSLPPPPPPPPPPSSSFANYNIDNFLLTSVVGCEKDEMCYIPNCYDTTQTATDDIVSSTLTEIWEGKS